MAAPALASGSPESFLEDVQWYYRGHSALERLFRKPESDWVSIAVKTDLIGLAKRIPDLEFTSISHVDATWQHQNKQYWFHCIDGDSVYRPQSASVVPAFNILGKQDRRSYEDPLSVYPFIRQKDWAPEGTIKAADIQDIAIFASRFMSGISADQFDRIYDHAWPDLQPEELRRLLHLVITGPGAALGLSILSASGFVDRFFPELSDMNHTEHSKDGHPEGNVWAHSLDSLTQRKTMDETLGLAIFLHDCGKPLAPRNRQRMFDGHAELGAQRARRFLARLGYNAATISSICWLVEHHMIPQALDVLPLNRTEKLMANEQFPLLLELYRCDLSSTYRGPNGYFEACKRFRNWLRNSKNPWMTLDRKRMIQRFVAN